MDSFYAQFSATNTNPSTTTMATTNSTFSSSSSSSYSYSNVSLAAEQNMFHPQNVVHFPNNSETLGFPATPFPQPVTQFSFQSPYFVPYELQNMQFPSTQTFTQVNHHFSNPLHSFPMEESNEVLLRMQNCRREGRKIMEASIRREARERRKQARQQRSGSSAPPAVAPSVSTEGTIRGQQPLTSGESNDKVTVTQNRNPNVFCAPDGKRLEEILTKKLQNSDVSCLGRIILPKREAEAKLPDLSNKEGIDILLRDVYSDLPWTLRYRFWCNNKSRMYVLENAGDFVNHYGLQNGDSLTLYEDESKNLYVSTKKERNQEVLEPSTNKQRLQIHGTYNYSYTQSNDEDEASLALLIEELSNKREEEAANSLLTLCSGGGGGGPSSGTEYVKLPNYVTGGSSSQIAEQPNIEAAAPSSKGKTKVLICDDQQNSIDDVYGGLDNILDVGHLTDYKKWTM
ncbi:B3 domain-containing transcription factor LEC2-like [Gastrolobium bilobum]|uniref:B3 domain-containing transcription factor LEC2-like n=1 Tax=Gastrolobium bilobum TaxID=150636 RepID=UPI002AB1A752|nr:B3 domain-containing transcription factor LEC2-like [Gastrolobium bilobum]